MVFDLPNFVTLPIELGVAMMILIFDSRQRKREGAAIIRSQQRDTVQRDAEIRQRERFNNWAEESAKRQIMLLESIMVTLDSEKVDEFKAQVGTRYTKEISEDIDELEKLLDQKHKEAGSNPELEADIESKINEIESGKSFIANFLPDETLNQIQRIADSAKQAYKSIREIPEIISEATAHVEVSEMSSDDVEAHVEPREGEYSFSKAELSANQNGEDPISEYRKESAGFAEKINTTITQALQNMKKDIIAGVHNQEKSGSEVTVSGGKQGKVMDTVMSALKDLGLDSLVKKKQKDENEENDSQAKE